MNRFRALLLISIFILGIVAAGVPAQATFTLGDLKGTNPYDINNFDPHVPGVIGYVWPGAGQCAWDGYPNQASDNCSPGYQSPYPNGNPPGAPSNSWYQLQGDTYAPFGAVLTGSAGDMVFALNATAWSTAACQASGGTSGGCTRFTGRWGGVDILIPPGFAIPGTPQIISTITNEYPGVVVSRISPNDRYAPGWTMVRIQSTRASILRTPTQRQSHIMVIKRSTSQALANGIMFASTVCLRLRSREGTSSKSCSKVEPPQFAGRKAPGLGRVVFPPKVAPSLSQPRIGLSYL